MQFLTGARERAKHRRALEPHLSPDAMKRVARDQEMLKLSAETRTISFLVCRMRGFAEIAASFAGDAEGLARLARLAMAPLAKAVLEREGTIDRMGPGLLTAYFNAPFEDAKHAVHACGAALAMMAALEKVNAALDRMLHADGSPAGGIGVGIDTGAAIAGNFGTDERPSYTVLARAAELADEFERMSAGYGASILVGATTRKLAEEHLSERSFAFLEVDHVAFGGPETLPLFSLLGTPLSRANPKFMALKAFHDRIFEAYRAREWEKARALIGQARALSGANPVLYDLYLARIAHFESQPWMESGAAAARAAANEQAVQRPQRNFKHG